MTSRVKSASTGKLLGKSMRNFTNVRLHEGLDLANAYSGKVQSHFHVSKHQNHVLGSACRNYDRLIKRTQSSAGFQTRTHSREQSQRLSRPKSSVRNPQDKTTQFFTKLLSCQPQVGVKNFSLLKNVLNSKAETMPNYSQIVKGLCENQKSLQQEIKKLKELITVEDKKKTKAQISSNKMMNQIQNINRLTQKKEEENYNLSVKINATQIECNDLIKDIDQINGNLNYRKRQVEEEKGLVKKFKAYVDETRLVVMCEDREVARMKEEVTKAYHTMNNSYMRMNQFKEEKAQLLIDIDNQHQKNL